MPRNLDSGAKIGSATFVATSVGFGPQGGQGGGGIRTHDRWDPRAASLTIGPRGVISPGESSPRGIVPLGNHPPGESSARGIIPQGNHSPGESLPGESFPWGIISQGNHPLGNDSPDWASRQIRHLARLGISPERLRPAISSLKDSSQIGQTLARLGPPDWRPAGARLGGPPERESPPD